MSKPGKTVAQFAAEAADREAIRDCLYRYCRGIDRCDFDLVRGSYWEDATDDHGMFKGTASDFIAFAEKFLPTMDMTQHFIGNILIELDGGTARVESYYRAFHRLRRAGVPPYDLVSAGRFVDRMERRNDEWRVADRLVLRDWFREYPDSADWDKVTGGINRGGRKPDDLSYGRFTD